MQKNATSHAGYGHFLTEEGDEYGSFEVFYMDRDMAREWNKERDDDTAYWYCGWYWWSCFPGCLPDGDPNGSFNTSRQAHTDAREEF